MKKNVVKIVVAVLVCLAIVGIVSTTVFADAGDILKNFNPNTGSSAAKSVNTMGEQIVGIIQVAGTAIAVGMLLFLAIKYLRASPEGKGQIKESATIYIVGAIVLFAAVNIVRIIYQFSTDAVKAP